MLRLKELLENYNKNNPDKTLNVPRIVELCYSEKYVSKEIYLHKLMNGKSNTIEINLVKKLCDILGITPNELFNY